MLLSFATKKKTLKKLETVKLSPVSTRQANKISRPLNSKTVFRHSRCDARPFTFVVFTPRDGEVHTSAPCKQPLDAPLPSPVVLLDVVCRCCSRCCSSSRWSAQENRRFMVNASTCCSLRLSIEISPVLFLSCRVSFLKNNPVSSSLAILVSELLKQNQKIYMYSFPF
jgi:hypothetical protein